MAHYVRGKASQKLVPIFKGLTFIIEGPDKEILANQILARGGSIEQSTKQELDLDMVIVIFTRGFNQSSPQYKSLFTFYHQKELSIYSSLMIEECIRRNVMYKGAERDQYRVQPPPPSTKPSRRASRISIVAPDPVDMVYDMFTAKQQHLSESHESTDTEEASWEGSEPVHEANSDEEVYESAEETGEESGTDYEPPAKQLPPSSSKGYSSRYPEVIAPGRPRIDYKLPKVLSDQRPDRVEREHPYAASGEPQMRPYIEDADWHKRKEEAYKLHIYELPADTETIEAKGEGMQGYQVLLTQPPIVPDTQLPVRLAFISEPSSTDHHFFKPPLVLCDVPKSPLAPTVNTMLVEDAALLLWYARAKVCGAPSDIIWNWARTHGLVSKSVFEMRNRFKHIDRLYRAKIPSDSLKDVLAKSKLWIFVGDGIYTICYSEAKKANLQCLIDQNIPYPSDANLGPWAKGWVVEEADEQHDMAAMAVPGAHDGSQWIRSLNSPYYQESSNEN